MKKIIVFGLMAVMTLCMATLLAQDKKKKKDKEDKKEQKEEEATPVFNYVIDDPMDKFGPQYQDMLPGIRYFLLPEFYTFWPVTNNDTVFKYECYDVNHNLILADTIGNINNVYYISLIKTYNDQLHTIIDQEGRPRPKPVGSIIYRYERTSSSTWKSTDMINHFTMELTEDKSVIVRKDTTVIVNSITGHKEQTVRKYYKVTEGEKYTNTDIPAGSNTPNDGSKNPTTVVTYLVPEFYFPVAKMVKDTTFEFFCYDNRDSLIPSVKDFDNVRYYSLYKKFADSAHTYNDNGVQKPLPVSVIVKRYDQTAKAKWMSIEYPSNKFTELKGFKDVIVSSDSTIVVDPISGNEIMFVYNFYKVIKN